jgi:hypothetical protein
LEKYGRLEFFSAEIFGVEILEQRLAVRRNSDFSAAFVASFTVPPTILTYIHISSPKCLKELILEIQELGMTLLS